MWCSVCTKSTADKATGKCHDPGCSAHKAPPLVAHGQKSILDAVGAGAGSTTAAIRAAASALSSEAAAAALSQLQAGGGGGGARPLVEGSGRDAADGDDQDFSFTAQGMPGYVRGPPGYRLLPSGESMNPFNAQHHAALRAAEAAAAASLSGAAQASSVTRTMATLNSVSKLSADMPAVEAILPSHEVQLLRLSANLAVAAQAAAAATAAGGDADGGDGGAGFFAGAGGALRRSQQQRGRFMAPPPHAHVESSDCWQLRLYPDSMMCRS
jgi:hypothetical protein